MKIESKAEEDGGRQVIARAAAVLRTLETAPAGLTIARITQACGLPRTTVTRLVNSLQAEQFVTAHGTTIRLGPALLRLAAAAHLDAATLMRPHLEALSCELRETVDLWIERETSAELVDEVTSDREVRIVSPAGFQLPLNTTAPGKVFLANLSDEEIAIRAGAHLAARTPRSLTTINALLADLEKTRKTGIALDIEEHAEDVCAIAMEVKLGLIGRYAIAIPVPARRFHETRHTLQLALEEAVRAIQERL